MTEERRSANPLLAQFLRDTRSARRLRQEDVARAVGSDTDTVGRYERDEESPRIDWLQRWADVMQLTVAERSRLNEVYLRTGKEPFATEERLFLEELSKPSLVFGGVELNTKLVPTRLWDAPLTDNIYRDDPEEENRKDGRRIRLDWTDARLPEDLLVQLILEMKETIDAYERGRGTSTLTRKQYQALDDTYKRITQERSNPYPRPVAVPEIIDGDYGRLFRILLGEGKYGVALVEERKLALPAALEARQKHVLHSLALRVAYLYKVNVRDEIHMMEFQQRQPGPHATWPGAWDVGGAGYFDPENHADPRDRTRVSPWKGCMDEISKELGIPGGELPHRDRCHFFGLANDQPTGHIILIGYCVGGYAPARNRPRTALVNDYDRCRLTPEDVADLILEKHKWVPAALLTSILTLEAFGFSRERIETAFARLAGQIDLSHE